MRVIALRGAKCPRENNPRSYINDSVAVNVPDTSYYRRRIEDGSLVLVGETSVPENKTVKRGKK